MTDRQPRQRQCKACPWKRGVDPHTIPNGYQVKKHRALCSTIAEPGALAGGTLRLMACHESPVGRDRPCVGWLAHQIGPGNNIGLRLAVMGGRVNGYFETVGSQHERFEDTLPQ